MTIKKTILIAFVLGFFISLLPLTIGAEYSVYTEDFNSYILEDDIINVSDWYWENDYLIKDTFSIDGYSLRIPNTTKAIKLDAWASSTINEIYEFEWNFYPSKISSNVSARITFRVILDDVDFFFKIWREDATNFQMCVYRYPIDSCYGTTTIGSIAISEWHKIRMKFDRQNRLFYWSLDQEDWQDPIEFYPGDCLEYCEFYMTMITQNQVSGYFHTIYMDDFIFTIGEAPSGPGVYDNPLSCLAEGFCWEWYPLGLWPFPSSGGYCYDCLDPSLCGVDIFSCGECLLQADCEETNYCIWSEGQCLLEGLIECGDGYSCPNCYSTSTCWGAGCYWATTTETCSQFWPYEPEFTDPDFGLWGNWIRDVLIYLFKPDMVVIERSMKELMNSLSYKFPWGYVALIKDVVEEKLTEAEAEATSTLPIYTMTIQGHELTMLDFKSINDNVPTFFSIAKTLITFFLGSSLILYIWERIKESDVGV